jgi:membrane associated rhomboid family serine protease
VRFPLVNYALIAACVAGFVFELTLGHDVEALIRTWGFTPSALKDVVDGQRDRAAPVAITLFSSLFLHGSWFHVIGNLLYLRVFGDNIEDRFGHFGYLLFYVAAGVAGAVGQYFLDPDSHLPMIGASGAIAGVLGAYIVLFPRARILTLFPVFIFLTFLEVPAILFLGIWGVQQLLNGFLAIAVTVQTQGAGEIAWFAHIGGFSLGILFGAIGRVFAARRAKRRTRNEESYAG